MPESREGRITTLRSLLTRFDTASAEQRAILFREASQVIVEIERNSIELAPDLTMRYMRAWNRIVEERGIFTIMESEVANAYIAESPSAEEWLIQNREDARAAGGRMMRPVLAPGVRVQQPPIVDTPAARSEILFGVWFPRRNRALHIWEVVMLDFAVADRVVCQFTSRAMANQMCEILNEYEQYKKAYNFALEGTGGPGLGFETWTTGHRENGEMF